MKYIIAIIIVSAFGLLYAVSHFDTAVGRSSPFSSSKSAAIQVTWAGRGPVELIFNDTKYTFSQGEVRTLPLYMDTPYMLKIKWLWREYLYSDYIVFHKDKQNITVHYIQGAISITDPYSTTEQIDSSMVFVSGRRFNNGCANTYGSPCDDWERRNSDDSMPMSDFRIGKYDVTQLQWRAIMGSDPSYFKGCPDCPVESVSWTEVQVFISKLNELSGKHYRLPTAAEWEYAARGGNKMRGDFYTGLIGGIAWNQISEGDWEMITGHKLSTFKNCLDCMITLTWENVQEFIVKLNEKQKDMQCSVPTRSEWEAFMRESNAGNQYAGGNILSDVAWYYGNSDFKTHPVGQLQPNELGLYDMNGNVWQWCSDWWMNTDWNYGTTNVDDHKIYDPQDPKNPRKRIVRGSPWWMSYSRLTFLFGWAPGYKFNDTGFRLVQD